jgi:hypothetical protein
MGIRIPPAADDASPATRLRSTTATRRPLCASRQAIVQPMIPPPMTTTS